MEESGDMFYGEFEHSIDRKDRLIIPSKFREAFKENYIDKFYVTRGLDKCLFLFTEEEWKNQEQKFKAIPFTKPDGRRFARIFFSGAVALTCDKQGRILLPAYLKDFAGIKKDVMIVGLSNRIEIWNKDSWKNYFDTWKESVEEVAERLVGNN